MEQVIPILLFVIGAALVYLGAFVWGYEKGVKDTEQRWSDAVKRKEGIS